MKRKRSNSNSQLNNIYIHNIRNMSCDPEPSEILNKDDFYLQYRSETPTKRRESLLEDMNQERKKKKIANIIVVVRKRPLSNRELEFNSYSTIRILNRKIVILLDPYEYNGHSEIFKNRNKEQHYTFDYAYDEDSSQEDIYKSSVCHIIDNIIDGYNCTIFAYGATGAGKTYSMFGTDSSPGIIPQSLSNLFNEIERLEDKEILIKIWYLEIYNEVLRDLIKPNNEDQLDIREDPTRGSIVNGITEVIVSKTNEILSIIKKANKNRTTESTNANEASSRSHAVLQVSVEIKDKSNSGIQLETRYSKFSLIDLAGSERASATQNKGIRLIEGANINRSLLTLGNCITALSDAAEKGVRPHVPYRDSKLTRILKDSLGGNSKTVMIANISPSVISFDDTYNTLKYANRAKHIKTQISKNVYNTQQHIANYENIINSLKSEIFELKQQRQNVPRSLITTEESVQSNQFHSIFVDLKSIFEEEIKIKDKISKIKLELIKNEEQSLVLQEDNQNNTNNTNNINNPNEKQGNDKEKLLISNETILNSLNMRKGELIKSALSSNNTNNSNNNNNKLRIRNEILYYINEQHDYRLNTIDKSNENIILTHSLGKKDLYIKELELQIKLRDDIINNTQIKIEETDKLKLKSIKELKKLNSQSRYNFIFNNLYASQTPNLNLNKKKGLIGNILPPISSNLNPLLVKEKLQTNSNINTISNIVNSSLINTNQYSNNNNNSNNYRKPNKTNSSNSISALNKRKSVNKNSQIKSKHDKNRENSKNKLNSDNKLKNNNRFYRFNNKNQVNNEKNSDDANEISHISAGYVNNKVNNMSNNNNINNISNKLDHNYNNNFNYNSKDEEDTIDLNLSSNNTNQMSSNVTNALNNNKNQIKKREMISYLYQRGSYKS